MSQDCIEHVVQTHDKLSIDCLVHFSAHTHSLYAERTWCAFTTLEHCIMRPFDVMLINAIGPTSNMSMLTFRLRRFLPIAIIAPKIYALRIRK